MAFLYGNREVERKDSFGVPLAGILSY